MFSTDKIEVVANGDRCARCGACEEICPADVFRWEGERIVTDHPGWCIKCGHCVAVCPEGALEHSSLALDRFEPVGETRSSNADGLEEAFRRRRSCRRFESSPVDRALVEELLDKARYAPTATNAQSVRFVALDDKADIQELGQSTARYYLALRQKIENPLFRLVTSWTVGRKVVEAYRFHMPAIAARFTRILEGEDRLFYGAPVVVVVLASGTAQMAAANCNLAAMQLLLAAEAMGLGACYNGYAVTALARDKRTRDLVELPREYLPGAVIALGKPSGEFHRIPPRRKRRVIWAD